MKQRLRGITAGLWCGLALAGAVTAKAQTKVWSIKLETVGWQDPYVEMTARFKPAPKPEPGPEGGDNHARFIAALKANGPSWPADSDLGVIWRDELVVDSSGRVTVGFAAKRAGLDAPKSLRVVSLDGKDGATVQQMELPTPVWDRTAVMLASDGALLVVAGDRVQRLKNDGTVENSIPIPPQPKINPGLWVEQSPSGQTLMLTTDDKFFRFVRTDTLATLTECRKENDEIHTLTDALAVGMGEDKNHQFELHYGSLCGRMPVLWSLPSGGRSDKVHLLDDGSLVEVGLEEVRRLTLRDQTVWSWKGPKGTVTEDLDGMAISRNGERMAVQLTVFHDLHPRDCMECKGPAFESWVVGIAVLDAKSGALVATVPVDHASLNRLAFALSPDGQKLALMNGGVLELWEM